MNEKYTKKIFADTLKELSKTKDLKRIKVSDIIKECSLNRGTFYYHFKDKDDLISWIFQTDIVEYFREAKRKEWTHNTYHFLKVMQKDRAFYRQALEIDTYNNLKKLLYDMNLNAALSIINNALNGRQLSEEGRNFLADFYASAFTETNIHFLKTDTIQTPEKLLQYYYDLSEPSLFLSLDRFIEHDQSKGMLPEQ